MPYIDRDAYIVGAFLVCVNNNGGNWGTQHLKKRIKEC